MRYSDRFKNHYCKQMLTPETITSAANPLLKDVRRAVARGSLTDEGWCIAETFHLLEEALRSDARSRRCWPRKARAPRSKRTGSVWPA